MRSYVSLLSAHIPALLAGAEDATSPDMSMTRSRATLTDDGIAAAQKLFHVLVMNVRGPALSVIRGITDMNRALAWRALITRYAPNTAPRVQSLISAILNVKTFPSELIAYEIALNQWQENIRKWESISGDRFNVSMKKAIFLDKAPSTVRIQLQMQSLDTFEAMTAVTLQFLQQRAVSSRRNRIAQYQDYKSKGKSKTDGQESSCFVCGRIAHMTKDCWFKDTNEVNTSKDGCFKDTGKGGPPSNKGTKGKGKGKCKGTNSVKEVTESTVTPTGGTTSSTTQISRITQDDTWDRPHPQNADEEYETGHLSATIRYKEPLHQYKDWYVVRVLVGQLCGRASVFSARLRMD